MKLMPYFQQSLTEIRLVVVLYQRLVEGKPQRTIAKETEMIQRIDAASKTGKQDDDGKK